MIFDEWLQFDVGKDIATINNERFVPEKRLHVFNAATGSEENGFVHQPKGQIRITISSKHRSEGLGQPVRIDNERRYPRINQMIECECNQGLLENWNERFRQIISQWSQAHASSRGQDECLSDCRHRANNSAWRKKPSGAVTPPIANISV